MIAGVVGSGGGDWKRKATIIIKEWLLSGNRGVQPNPLTRR